MHKLVLKYKPTGKIIELDYGIQRMNYNNELIMCPAWGYDKGEMTAKNNPNNWEIIEIKKIKKNECNI